MQCGDFSFPLYMTRRYLGGYGAGVTAISFLSITELIEEGIKNINNPFISAIVKKNSYSIGNTITPIGIAFYIAPYIIDANLYI